MKKLVGFLDENLEKYFLIATLIFMVIIITIQVVARMLGNSLIWTEEVTRYVMLYQIWVGAAYAVKRDAHLRIDVIKQKVSQHGKLKIEILVLILWTIFTLWLTIKSSSLTKILLDRNQLSPAIQIPMGYAYASVPVGCGLMTIRLCQKLYLNLKEYFKEQEV